MCIRDSLMIGRLAKEGSQFIIATHSPILLGLPGAQILCFDDGDLHPCLLYTSRCV